MSSQSSSKRKTVVDRLLEKPPFSCEKLSNCDSENKDLLFSNSRIMVKKFSPSPNSRSHHKPNCTDSCHTTINLYINDLQYQDPSHVVTSHSTNEIAHTLGKNIPDHNVMRSLLQNLDTKKFSSRTELPPKPSDISQSESADSFSCTTFSHTSIEELHKKSQYLLKTETPKLETRNDIASSSPNKLITLYARGKDANKKVTIQENVNTSSSQSPGEKLASSNKDMDTNRCSGAHQKLEHAQTNPKKTQMPRLDIERIFSEVNTRSQIDKVHPGNICHKLESVPLRRYPKDEYKQTQPPMSELRSEKKLDNNKNERAQIKENFDKSRKMFRNLEQQSNSPEHAIVPHLLRTTSAQHDLLGIPCENLRSNLLKAKSQQLQAPKDVTINVHDDRSFQSMDATVKNWQIKKTNDQKTNSEMKDIYDQKIIENYKTTFDALKHANFDQLIGGNYAKHNVRKLREFGDSIGDRKAVSKFGLDRCITRDALKARVKNFDRLLGRQQCHDLEMKSGDWNRNPGLANMNPEACQDEWNNSSNVKLEVDVCFPKETRYAMTKLIAQKDSSSVGRYPERVSYTNRSLLTAKFDDSDIKVPIQRRPLSKNKGYWPGSAERILNREDTHIRH